MNLTARTRMGIAVAAAVLSSAATAVVLAALTASGHLGGDPSTVAAPPSPVVWGSVAVLLLPLTVSMGRRAWAEAGHPGAGLALLVVQPTLVLWLSALASALLEEEAHAPVMVALVAGAVVGGSLLTWLTWWWWPRKNRYPARTAPTRIRRPEATSSPTLVDVAPGEIWWATVPFEEGAGSKDRPCLVLRSRGEYATVLMFTSQDKSGRRGYAHFPHSAFSRESKDTWLRLDRRIDIRRDQFRRSCGMADPTILSAAGKAHRELRQL